MSLSIHIQCDGCRYVPDNPTQHDREYDRGQPTRMRRFSREGLRCDASLNYGWSSVLRNGLVLDYCPECTDRKKADRLHAEQSKGGDQ